MAAWTFLYNLAVIEHPAPAAWQAVDHSWAVEPRVSPHRQLPGDARSTHPAENVSAQEPTAPRAVWELPPRSRECSTSAVLAGDGVQRVIAAHLGVAERLPPCFCRP